MKAERKLSLHCSFGTYLNTALRNQLIFGLQSQTIQGRLLEINNLTFDKALETAMALESSISNAAQLHKPVSNANQVNSLSKKRGNRKNSHNSSNSCNRSSVKNFLLSLWRCFSSS